jgi:NAD(P)-dependent dehydrogenase (short-subunit alcohol dehydrogenase family)
MAGRVAGKSALVVGAGSGIGRAAAAMLAAEGAAVGCADLDAEAAAGTAADIRSRGGRALSLRLDVTREEDWAAATERVAAEFGGVDVVVNSAGISSAAPIAETTLADWRRMMAVTADGAFLGIRAAVTAMRRAGRGGSVVTVSSASGVKAVPGAAAYCAAKAAVLMLSRSAALECRREGIRVNTVLPAGVKTPLWRGMPFFRGLVAEKGSEDAAFAALAGPDGRFADPDEVAAAILFLASDESRYITGTELLVDNGYTAG